jgi:hypothetical protein
MKEFYYNGRRSTVVNVRTCILNKLSSHLINEITRDIRIEIQMLVTMPHVNQDKLELAEEEYEVYWRPIPSQQCANYNPRPPVYEHPTPHRPSYEYPSQHHLSTYEHPPRHRPCYEYPSQHYPSTYDHPPPQRPNYVHHSPPAWTEWPHHPPPSFAYYHRAPPPPQSSYPVYHSSAVPSPLSPPPLPPPPVDVVYEVGHSDVLCGKITWIGFSAVFLFLLFLFSLCLSHIRNADRSRSARQLPSR